MVKVESLIFKEPNFKVFVIEERTIKKNTLSVKNPKAKAQVEITVNALKEKSIVLRSQKNTIRQAKSS